MEKEGEEKVASQNSNTYPAVERRSLPSSKGKKDRDKKNKEDITIYYRDDSPAIPLGRKRGEYLGSPGGKEVEEYVGIKTQGRKPHQKPEPFKGCKEIDHPAKQEGQDASPNERMSKSSMMAQCIPWSTSTIKYINIGKNGTYHKGHHCDPAIPASKARFSNKGSRKKMGEWIRHLSSPPPVLYHSFRDLERGNIEIHYPPSPFLKFQEEAHLHSLLTPYYHPLYLRPGISYIDRMDP